MKKILLLFVLTAMMCSSTVTALGAPDTRLEQDKSLIIYYSLTGSTKTIAGYIQEFVGGEMAEIKTVKPYPEEFEAVVRQARQERQDGYLPPIRPIDVDLKDYETIYPGFPIWGNTIPQPMATFLSKNNLAGKTIIPFCTHDDFGVGRSHQVISEYCPKATLMDGFDMVGANVRTGRGLVSSWLSKIGRLPANDSVDINATKETPVVISIGDTLVTGYLNDSHEAREFIKMLPKSVSMVGYGGREYYGSIPERIEAKREGQLRFDDGDITYCPQNNTVAIFYAQADRPNLTMRVIPIGKVTSDLAVFQNFDSSIDVMFNFHK